MIKNPEAAVALATPLADIAAWQPLVDELEVQYDTGVGISREHMAGYLRFENYANNLRRLGWSDTDLSDGGSDALVDAIVAWGDAAAVERRVRAHLDAGADHVCLQVLGADPAAPPLAQLRELARLTLL